MIPNEAKRLLLRGDVHLENDDFEVLLLNDGETFTPDPNDHEYVADVLDDATEYGDENYERKELENTEVVTDGNQVQWQADDPVWEDLGSELGEIIQTVVVFRDEVDDSESTVIRILDDSWEPKLPLGTNGSSVTFEWDDAGILTLE